MLRDLRLKAVYRTDEDNILEDFYIPALSVAVSYQRAVGFFSAAMLSYAAQGLSAFVQNQGKMQLIVGGELDADDEDAMRKGYDARAISERLDLKVLQIVDSIADALCYRRLEALSWLIATGRLDIKIALRRRGMYHEKIGVIRDADGDAIVFQGSANETAFAILPDFNFESINVFPCWREEYSAHFTPYLRGFERLWDNQSPGTQVIDFPEASKRRLIKIAEKCRVPSPEVEITLANPTIALDGESGVEAHPTVPSLLDGIPFAMRAHQLQALNSWKASSFRGIFAHATGSGKTIAAAYGAIRLFEATRRLALVISVPYQNLADQWVRVLSQFRISAIRAYGSRGEWYAQTSERLSLFLADAAPFLCIVVVNRTLQSDDFQRKLASIPGEHLMWVGDECHHHAGRGLASALPQHAQMRLGLSATPEHYVDDTATSRLKGYYGEIVSEFTLADALGAGVIAPYDYHVSAVSLNESETEAYLDLSRQISVVAGRTGASEDSDDDRLRALLMRRARILGGAGEKLIVLRRLLEGRPPHPFALFYCGDGSTEDEDTGDAMRDIERVSELLYGLGWKCSRFTARESRDDREKLLSAFRIAALDALVAIRCLDEGIDVPACRTAYLLASSRNPKQFIQRRGRILRKSEGKNHATIFDFVVRLPPGKFDPSPLERRLVAGELARVAEFARLSRNSADSVRSLMPLLKEYDLAHALV